MRTFYFAKLVCDFPKDDFPLASRVTRSQWRNSELPSVTFHNKEILKI